MAVTVTDLSTLDGDPLIRGTSDTDARLTLDIDAGASGVDSFNTVAYGGEWMVKTANPFEMDRVVVKSKGSGGVRPGNTYNLHPIFIQCHNGDVLLIYTTGTSHLSPDDITVSKRSTDGGLTYGAETLVLENPDYLTDGAGCVMGTAIIDPDTGRIIVFAIFRTTSAASPQFVTKKFGYIYSDDHGVTWSAFNDIYSQFVGYPDIFGDGTPDLSTFSQGCKTSLGLIVPMYATSNATYIMYSTDNGVTWSEANTILVDTYNNSPALNEPSIVQIDTDRLVMVVRNDSVDDEFFYYKTSDGGVTWTARQGPYKYTTLSMPQGSAPIMCRKIGGQILSWFIARRNATRGASFSRTRVGVEAFWQEPQRAWDPGTPYPNSRQSKLGTASSHYLNCGYADIIPLPAYPYTALVVYYDQAAGDVSEETEIVLETFPRAFW